MGSIEPIEYRSLYALDTKTGNKKWQFNNEPSPYYEVSANPEGIIYLVGDPFEIVYAIK